MAEPVGWEVVAYNTATESENKIHEDSVARQYGFRGGLVPGVTVYAYLAQPGIVAWGLDWLSRGAATVVLRKPVYDGDRTRVGCKTEGPEAYEGEITDPEGTLCATGRFWIPEAPTEPPQRRGDPPARERGSRSEATRPALERLRETGLGSFRVEWRGDPPYERYTRTLDEMPDLVRHDVGGLAHPYFTLGLANTILAVNVALGPWIHVQSEVQHYAPIPLGSRLHVEGRVTDLFEKRGHEFVDLDVAVFLDEDRPVLRADHRAIYRLR